MQFDDGHRENVAHVADVAEEMVEEWHYEVKGERQGPVTRDALVALIAEGKVTKPLLP